MITIGYGDIYPVTMYERGFVILITLISCGVFAYSVNQIGMKEQTQKSKNIIYNYFYPFLRDFKVF